MKLFPHGSRGARIRLLALLLLLGGALWLRLGWAGPAPLEINLSGNAERMGADFAKAAPMRLNWLAQNYLRDVICRGNERFFEQCLDRTAPLRPLLSEAHRAELNGFAEAADLRPETALLANAFLDMGLYTGGCRSVVYATDTDLYHAHNMDWDGMAGAANWVVSIVRRTPDDGRFRTVSVTTVGLLGALDVINKHGVALSVNQSPASADEPVEPTFLRIRRIAEQCRTFHEARRALLAGPSKIPFHITLSSASEQLAAVFESGEEFVERPMRSGIVGADNAHWGKQSSTCPTERVAAEVSVETADDVKEILRHEDVLMSCNIYSVIFDYAANRLHLASGRTPAAPNDYREFVLFHQRRNRTGNSAGGE